jgi:DNA repair exonuclease SbcCD ATPase subunit
MNKLTPFARMLLVVAAIAGAVFFFKNCQSTPELDNQEEQVEKIQTQLNKKTATYDSLMRLNLPVEYKIAYKKLKDSLEELKIYAADFIIKIKTKKATSSLTRQELITDVNAFIKNYERLEKKLPTTSVPLSPPHVDTSWREIYIRELKQKMAKLEKTIEKYKKDINSLKKDIAAAKRDKKQLESKTTASIAEYQAALNKYKNLYEIVTKNFERLNTEYNTAVQNEKDAIAKGSSAKAEAQQWKDESASLAQQVQDSRFQKAELEEEMKNIVPIKISQANFGAFEQTSYRLVAKYPRRYISRKAIEYFDLSFRIEANKKNLKKIPIYISFTDKQGFITKDRKTISIMGQTIIYHHAAIIDKLPYDVRHTFGKPENHGPYEIKIYTELSAEPFWKSQKIETEEPKQASGSKIKI